MNEQSKVVRIKAQDYQYIEQRAEASFRGISDQVSYMVALVKRAENLGIGLDAYEPPSLDEVIQYFNDKGYSSEGAKRAYEYYAELAWHDKNGKPVKNWKTKMANNWFKDDFKLVDESQSKAGSLNLYADDNEYGL